jgi:hypothetical protein
MGKLEKDLHIAIITRGRIDEQRTLRQMSPEVRKYVTLYVHPGEKSQHEKNWGGKVHDIVDCPKEAKNIGEIREWVAWNAPNGKVIFADDDLKFCVRKKDYKSPKTMIPKNYTPEEILEHQTDMFNWMWKTLDEPDIGVVSVPQRQYNLPNTPFLERDKRFYSFWGLNVEKYTDERNDVFMSQWPIKEDFIVGIAMRQMGYHIAINNGYAWDSWDSNHAGGCSNYRTIQMQNDIAKRMAEKWPDFVSIKVRNNKHWGGEFEGKESLDVTIKWSKIEQIK